MGYGRVYLQGLERDALALLLRHVLERAHVVEAVHELDDEDARVLPGGHQELAQGFAVPLGAAVLVAAELGDAFDQESYLLSELRLYLLGRDAHVLYRVVQEPCGDGFGGHAELCKPFGGLHEMHEVGLAREALVVLVGLGDEMVGLLHQSLVGLGGSAHPVEYVLERGH